jgi:hypothetical protein
LFKVDATDINHERTLKDVKHYVTHTTLGKVDEYYPVGSTDRRMYPLPLHDGIRTTLNIDNKIIVKYFAFELSSLYIRQKYTITKKLVHLTLPKIERKRNKKALTSVTVFIKYLVTTRCSYDKLIS